MPSDEYRQGLLNDRIGSSCKVHSLCWGPPLVFFLIVTLCFPLQAVKNRGLYLKNSHLALLKWGARWHNVVPTIVEISSFLQPNVLRDDYEDSTFPGFVRTSFSLLEYRIPSGWLWRLWSLLDCISRFRIKSDDGCKFAQLSFGYHK